GDGGHGMALAPADFAKERAALLALWEEEGRTGAPALSMRLKLFIEGVSKEVLSFPTRSIVALKGGVQEVVDAMGAYADAGMDHLVFDMSTQAHENILATMETFASEVRPKLS
ncbi:MAG: hypothetical protein O2807_12535, partial [bacterium]|nr:hypothetical protein [bacterium]